MKFKEGFRFKLKGEAAVPHDDGWNGRPCGNTVFVVNSMRAQFLEEDAEGKLKERELGYHLAYRFKKDIISVQIILYCEKCKVNTKIFLNKDMLNSGFMYDEREDMIIIEAGSLRKYLEPFDAPVSERMNPNKSFMYKKMLTKRF